MILKQKNNMEIDEKLKSKLEKLKELAERGVGGERTNAQLLMQRLADEYGIVLETCFTINPKESPRVSTVG